LGISDESTTSKASVGNGHTGGHFQASAGTFGGIFVPTTATVDAASLMTVSILEVAAKLLKLDLHLALDRENASE
jgi:hypothetical protein